MRDLLFDTTVKYLRLSSKILIFFVDSKLLMALDILALVGTTFFLKFSFWKD